MEVSGSDEFAVSRLEKKIESFSDSSAARATKDDDDDDDDKKPSRAFPDPASLACSGCRHRDQLQITRYRTSSAAGRGGPRDAFPNAGGENKSVSLGRRGRGHPGVRFPAPELRYGKHKNCNEKRASSRQSVTCGNAVKNVREKPEKKKQCADAARRGSVGNQTRARRVERSVSHPVVPASIGPRPRRPRGFERMPPSFVVFLPSFSWRQK